MSKAVLANEFATKLAKVLDIPIKYCTGMVITAEAGEAVRVRATYLVNEEQVDKVFELLEGAHANNIE